MITVMFFASVREAAGAERLEVEADNVATVTDVIRDLGRSDENLRRALERENLLVAVNQTMVDGTCRVEDGDEVAFFPPVTGG